MFRNDVYFNTVYYDIRLIFINSSEAEEEEEYLNSLFNCGTIAESIWYIRYICLFLSFFSY